MPIKSSELVLLAISSIQLLQHFAMYMSYICKFDFFQLFAFMSCYSMMVTDDDILRPFPLPLGNYIMILSLS
jgi:hypothetical protein